MKLKIPAGDFRAYLFDCDGTVVDSMPLHYIAWTETLGDWGCKFDEELFYSWGGMPPVEIVATLNKMQGLNMPVEEVAERKENLYYEQLSQLKPVPEVLEHIEAQCMAASPSQSFRAAAASRSSSRSRRCTFSTGSPSSWVRRTTNAASPRPTHFWLARRGSALHQKIAWFLKTLRWASRRLHLREWLQFVFHPRSKDAIEP